LQKLASGKIKKKITTNDLRRLYLMGRGPRPAGLEEERAGQPPARFHLHLHLFLFLAVQNSTKFKLAARSIVNI
jgi:hypothetical protein